MVRQQVFLLGTHTVATHQRPSSVELWSKQGSLLAFGKFLFIFGCHNVSGRSNVTSNSNGRICCADVTADDGLLSVPLRQRHWRKRPRRRRRSCRSCHFRGVRCRVLVCLLESLDLNARYFYNTPALSFGRLFCGLTLYVINLNERGEKRRAETYRCCLWGLYGTLLFSYLSLSLSFFPNPKGKNRFLLAKITARKVTCSKTLEKFSACNVRRNWRARNIGDLEINFPNRTKLLHTFY